MCRYETALRPWLAKALACFIIANAAAISQARLALADDHSAAAGHSSNVITLRAEVEDTTAAADATPARVSPATGVTSLNAAQNGSAVENSPPAQNPPPVDRAYARIPISPSAQLHNLFTERTGLPFAKIVLAVDCSGSMGTLFDSHTTQKVLSRLLPVLMDLTADHSIDCWLYADRFARLPNIVPQDLPYYVHTFISPCDKAGALGAGNEEGPLMREIAMHYGFQPTIVIVLTDTGVNYSEVKNELLASEGLPIFWQFVGLDPSTALTPPSPIPSTAGAQETEKARLEEAGLLDQRYKPFNDFRAQVANGQPIENSGFFPMDDYTSLVDGQIRDRIMSEFTQWSQIAEHLNILPSPRRMANLYQQ